MRPNLFILGAPKCGTTALAKWLGHHSEIHAPAEKEPHHFSTEYCLTSDRAKYENLFKGSPPNARWAFDASVWQLFSPSAVPNILRVRPDAHFIVMVRNPLQMIPSMHRQQVFNGNELEPALEKALALTIALLGCIFSGTMSDYVFHDGGERAELICLILVSIPIFAMGQVYRAMLNATRSVTSMVRVRIYTDLLSVVILATLIWPFGLVGAIIGYIALHLLFCFLQFCSHAAPSGQTLLFLTPNGLSGHRCAAILASALMGWSASR